MVTVSHASTQQSIEVLRTKFKKKQQREHCDVYDLLPVGSQECEGQVPDAMWELDIDELCTMRVQGGLKQKLSYWVDVLNAPDRVMEHGYVLPFQCFHLQHHTVVVTMLQLWRTVISFLWQSRNYWSISVLSKSTPSLLYAAHCQ